MFQDDSETEDGVETSSEENDDQDRDQHGRDQSDTRNRDAFM